jgi:acyl-CoA synthetase (AMP-forming)/AMP-acid ligase II
MVLGNLAACSYGAKMVIPRRKRSMPAKRWPPSTPNAAPPCMACPPCSQAMLDHPDFPRHDMRSLRTGIMAGAPCPEPLMRRVMEDMHCRQITIGYGMTETSPISFNPRWMTRSRSASRPWAASSPMPRCAWSTIRAAPCPSAPRASWSPAAIW